MPRRKQQPTQISYAVPPGSHWWAYARHSPGPDQTIHSQRQAIAEFAAQHGITITRWFVDEAVSGASLDRDAFAEMVEAAGILRPDPPPAQASGILVLNFARFGRDQEMAKFFVAGFRLRGWTVVPIQERDSLPEGTFASIFEALTHWKDQQRLEEITKETKRGLRRVVTQQVTLPDGRVVTGFSGGGFPPVGYRAEKIQTGTRKNGEPRYNSYWVADEAPDEYGETPWIRVCRAWEMMASGRHSYREIQDACHLFRALNSYNDFFRRRTYLGVRLCGDVEIPGAHPAATDAATFARVQRMMMARTRPIVHAKQAASDFLLTGMVRCGYCGGAMTVDRGVILCDRRKRRGKADCPNAVRIPIALVETTVLHAVAQRILTGGGIQPWLDAVNGELWQSSAQSNERLTQEERKLSRLDDSIAKLLDAVESGGGATVRTRLADRERELELVQARIAHLRREARRTQQQPASRAELVALVERLRLAIEQGNAHERRLVMESLRLRVRVWADQCEVQYELMPPPVAGEDEAGRSTPSGERRAASCAVRAPFVWNRHVHFNPASQRQVRHRTVNARGEIKLFGRQRYVKRELAGARVLVRLSGTVATVFYGEHVVRLSTVPGPKAG